MSHFYRMTFAIIAIALMFQRVPNAVAQLQFNVTTSEIGSVLHRGSYADFHVYAVNLGPGNVSDPYVIIASSDPANIPIMSANSKSWYGHYLRPDGTKYDLGDFAFSVSHNAPDGLYTLRIEVDYS